MRERILTILLIMVVIVGLVVYRKMKMDNQKLIDEKDKVILKLEQETIAEKDTKIESLTTELLSAKGSLNKCNEILLLDKKACLDTIDERNKIITQCALISNNNDRLQNELNFLKSQQSSCTNFQNNIAKTLTMALKNMLNYNKTIITEIIKNPGNDAYLTNKKVVLMVFKKPELLNKIATTYESVNYYSDLMYDKTYTDYPIRIITSKLILPNDQIVYPLTGDEVSPIENLPVIMYDKTSNINIEALMELIAYEPTQEEKAKFIQDTMETIQKYTIYLPAKISDFIYIDALLFREILYTPLFKLLKNCLALTDI